MAVIAAALLAGALPGAATARPADPPAPPQARILGGTPSSTAEAPWMVALATSAGKQFCGATLVRPNKVVTAAHCATDESTRRPSAADQLRIIAGRTDMRTDQGTVSEVRDVWVHPRYRGFLSGADVAVLTLRTPLAQRPLPLVGAGDTGSYRAGTPGRVLGWGKIGESGEASSSLRSVQIPVSADDACRRAYSQYKPSDMFCAGLTRGGRDACEGDSGGPFVVNGRLAGVVSFGTGCGRPGVPGVYARLSTYAAELDRQLQ